jgi:hypothetical protein
MKRWSFPIFGIFLGTIAAWLVFPGAIAVVQNSMPVGRWFDVDMVHVASVAEGEVPQVRITWRIRRPFAADWIATVRRFEDGDYSVQCSRTGRADFLQYYGPPLEADLDWWMGIPPNPQCPALVAGSYIVTMSWEIEIDGLPPRFVRAESNIFEVTE